MKTTGRYANRGVMFFDGECIICTRMARWFGGPLARRGFAMMPLQDARARERLGLKEGDPLTEMRVLSADGMNRGGAEAVVFLAHHIWWAQPLVLIWNFPGGRGLLDRLYRWVAQHRTCVGGACAIPAKHTHGKSSTQYTKEHQKGSAMIPTVLAVVPLMVLPVAAAVLGRGLPGWGYMWAIAFAIFAGCKILTHSLAVRRGGATAGRRIGYLYGWPGMDADAFLFGSAAKQVRPAEVVFGFAKLVFGFGLLFFVARRLGHDLAAGWVGMVGTIFVLHFGLFDLLALAWRARGIDARPLMVAPVFATSLGDFWGRRWNAAFNRLAFDHVFRPLARRVGAPSATLASFAVSGLVHDLVISVPARGGYGLPTAFFLLQGVGMLFEHSRVGRRLGLGQGVRGWLFTMTLVAGPAIFLFHPLFVRNVFLPFMETMGAL